jgi:coenzyme F420-0:L-glutamate ligase / coenzyme F420-1:gamma-L-glutamate ligase
MSLVLTPLKGVPLIRPGDNLPAVILDSLAVNAIDLVDGDILVLGQKIVSKAEGRIANLASVSPSPEAKEIARQAAKDPRLVELMLGESRKILRVRDGTIVVEHNLGFICANAGIDHSNVAGPGAAGEEQVLLLPRDPDRSAREIRSALEQRSGKHLGVLINDSHGRAWRLGTVGISVGLSGVPPLVDERGWLDLFGYRLRVTVVGVADELAAAASLMMGQASEGTPIVHARGFPYPMREGTLSEMIRPEAEDLFR